MIISLNWLRNYVEVPLSLEDLVHELTMAGLEVDGYHHLNPHLQKVVAVRLESFRKHSQADRLHVCQVSDGRNTYSIVCGAPDLEVGSIVPLALPGAELPNGITLKETQIR